MEKQTAIYIGLAIYTVAMLAITFYWMVRVKDANEYLVGGRGLKWWIVTGNIIGASVGTGVVIGGPGLAYQHGWAGAAYPIGLGVGGVLTGLLFARMRRYRFMTLSEEISSYYDESRVVVEFCNISLFFSQLCWLTVQIMGGGAILSVVSGIRPDVCTLVAGVAMAAISIPGGLKTVAYTDTLQSVILLVGLGTLGVSALEASGGLHGLRAAMPPKYDSFLGTASYGTGAIVSLMLALMLAVIADPGRRLSMFSASSERGALGSMLLSGGIMIGLSVVIAIIGMYAYHLNPNLPKADQAMPWLIMEKLPGWLAALVVVAMISAIFSTTNAISAGTFFVLHLFPLMTGRYATNPLRTVRIALICCFGASIGAALMAGSIVKFVTTFLPLTMNGIAVIVLVGLFWKRATWQGAVAALAVTPLVTIVFKYLPTDSVFLKTEVLPATIVGIAAHVVVSLMTPPRTRSFEVVAESLGRHRAAAFDGPSGHGFDVEAPVAVATPAS